MTTERAHPSVLAAKIAPISDERTPPANTSTSFVAPPGRAASLDAQWPVLARSSDRRIRRFDLPVGRGLGCKSGARWRRPAAALSGLPCTQVIAPGTSTTSVPVPNTAFNPERLSATGHGAWPPGASSPGGFVRAQAGSAEPEHTRDRRSGAALSCRSDQEPSSLWGVSASWSYGATFCAIIPGERHGFPKHEGGENRRSARLRLWENNFLAEHITRHCVAMTVRRGPRA